MPSLNVTAYISSEILQVKSSQVWDALTVTHTHTDSGCLSHNWQMSLTTLQTTMSFCWQRYPMGTLFHQMSCLNDAQAWSYNYVFCLDTKSPLGKKALTDQTPDIMSYRRCSCDHNSRWILTIWNWSRTYRGLATSVAASWIFIACTLTHDALSCLRQSNLMMMTLIASEDYRLRGTDTQTQVGYLP